MVSFGACLFISQACTCQIMLKSCIRAHELSQLSIHFISAVCTQESQTVYVVAFCSWGVHNFGCAHRTTQSDALTHLCICDFHLAATLNTLLATYLSRAHPLKHTEWSDRHFAGAPSGFSARRHRKEGCLPSCMCVCVCVCVCV